MEVIKKRVLTMLSLLIVVLLGSGCFINSLIPAPKRNFTSSDLLVTKDELEPGWTIPYGPKKDTDNSKPEDTMWEIVNKLPEREISDVTERASLYPTTGQAIASFKEDALFPSNIIVEGWNFASKKADEQKMSCYKYSNLDYPICRWLGRYQEIRIVVIAGLVPGRVTLDELQAIVRAIDTRIINLLDKK
jgi:hypothetical protein